MSNFRSGNLEQGQPLGAVTATYALLADDTAIPTQGTAMLLLSSDSSTASARTFTLAASSLVGHVLRVYFTSGSSTTAQLANTGATKLESDWTPVQYDLLTLVSDGTNWVEVSRGRSTGLSSLALANTHIYVGNASGVATDVALSGDATIANTGAMTIANSAISAAKMASDAVTTVKILNANVTLAKLAAGITPSHVVKFAGKYTTLGGSATEAQTLSGVLSTDVVVGTLQAKGGTPRTILTTAPTTDTITYVFSGDPSTDHVVSYVVYRAAS